MSKKNKNRSRTYARNRPVVSRRGLENIWESDGVYVFKLIVVTLFGLMWLRLKTPILISGFSLNSFPAGALIAVIGVAIFEKAQFNRKIMYAVLVITTIISYFVAVGIVI